MKVDVRNSILKDGQVYTLVYPKEIDEKLSLGCACEKCALKDLCFKLEIGVCKLYTHDPYSYFVIAGTVGDDSPDGTFKLVPDSSFSLNR